MFSIPSGSVSTERVFSAANVLLRNHSLKSEASDFDQTCILEGELKILSMRKQTHLFYLFYVILEHI